MTTSPISLRTPHDAAIAAPLMLGYWPAGSICAIFVNDEDRVVLIMRWDHDVRVTPPTLPPGLSGDAPLAACHLAVFPAGLQADDSSAWQSAVDRLEAIGIPLGWLLVVTTDGRDVTWTAPLGTAEGSDSAVIPGAQAAARARRWGLLPWRSCRSDYVGDIAPDPAARDRVAGALSPHRDAFEGRRAEVITEVRALLAGKRLATEEVVRVLEGLCDSHVRDTLLWDVMHEPPRMWPCVADRLAEVVAAAPDTHVAAPATLLAILRWQTGDGSRASAAIERALSADPSYTLAGLVDRCLMSGMHPQVWREGLSSLSRDECLRAA